MDEEAIDKYNQMNRDLIPRCEVVERIEEFTNIYRDLTRSEAVALDILKQEFITK